MTNEATNCACSDCTCEVTENHKVVQDGKLFCSDACANGHPNGTGCCNNTCECHG